MRLDVWKIRQRFGGLIWSRAQGFLKGRDEVDIEAVMESVYKDLERIGEIKGEHGEASLRAFIRSVTRYNCLDVIRRWESKKNYHPRVFQLEKHGPAGNKELKANEFGDRDGSVDGEGGVASPQRKGSIGADPVAIYEDAEFGAVQKRVVKNTRSSLAKKYRIKPKNLEIVIARKSRKSRREMAAMFGLSENQIKGRLERTKRKIWAAVEKEKRLGKLRPISK